MEPQFAVV